MSDSVYEQEVAVKKMIQRRLKGSMSPHDNVLYFSNNVDVRLCPKNGITTLKWCLFDSEGFEVDDFKQYAKICGTALHRRQQIKEYGYPMEFPFRRGSKRIAIVRDPIERFMSAAEYLKVQWEQHKDMLEAEEIQEGWQKLSDIDLIPDTIDEVIDSVSDGTIYNSHFFSQAYYLGNRAQYDEIYKFSEFGKFLDYLHVEVESLKPLNRVHENKTSGKYFGPASDLTEEQQDRIIKIFKQDYEYGWTEKNARSL